MDWLYICLEWILFLPVVVLPLWYSIKTRSFFYGVLVGILSGALYGVVWICLSGFWKSHFGLERDPGHPLAAGVIQGILWGVFAGVVGFVVGAVRKRRIRAKGG